MIRSDERLNQLQSVLTKVPLSGDDGAVPPVRQLNESVDRAEK